VYLCNLFIIFYIFLYFGQPLFYLLTFFVVFFPYSYGVRNPWRISFDSVSSNLWIGDVGQAVFEEVQNWAGLIIIMYLILIIFFVYLY